MNAVEGRCPPAVGEPTPDNAEVSRGPEECRDQKGQMSALGHVKKRTSLSCLSRRITRVYLYHWQPPPTVTNWDSGLLDRRGRPRPAFASLRRWLTRSARAARHGGRSDLCRPPA